MNLDKLIIDEYNENGVVVIRNDILSNWLELFKTLKFHSQYPLHQLGCQKIILKINI